MVSSPGYLSGCGALLGPGRVGDCRVRLSLRGPWALQAGRGMSHAADPPQCPHHPLRPRRDRSLGRALRRAGQALRRQQRDHPKWRKRGPDDCLDHSARPHQLPWKATDEERAVVCALRRSTNFALYDLTFVVSHFLPHLNRDSIWRILRAEGLSRRPPPASDQPKRGQCPSSNDLRRSRRLATGGSSSPGLKVRRPAADAASDGFGCNCSRSPSGSSISGCRLRGELR